KPYFRLPAVALPVAVLFGCGGGGSDPALNEQPLAVQLRETDTMLAVRAELPAQSSGAKSEFEAQALNFKFAAQVDSGPSAGLALKGRLELIGEREDDGVTEVEGRFFPDAAPSVPSREDLKAQFEDKRKALKVALRTDIKALSTELQEALSSSAVRGSDGPTAAQKQALSAFKAKFMQRMTQYREALSALIADYRAAKRDARSNRDEDDKAARGFEVEGTID